MPKVSVVVASYNHGKYVSEAIQSVLQQSYQDFEIIITDDGSTDRTVSKIKKISDPRIKLFCLERNQGQFVATNNSLKEAKGRYIAVLNSDDLFLPDKLAKQVNFLDGHPEIGAVFGQAEIIDEDGCPLADESNSYCRIFKQPNRYRFEWLNHFFYRGNCLCHPSVLIRRKCHETVGFYDERYAQLADFDFWVRLLMEYEIFVIQENLIKFRIRADNANAGAIKPHSLKGHYLEYYHILRNYLSIKSFEVFLKIFPEAKKYGTDIDEELIPFVLSMCALNTKSRYQINEAFGINTLFGLFADKKMARKISSKFGFDYIDLIKLTGQYDVFNIVTVKQLRTMQKKLLGKRLNKILKIYYKLRKTSDDRIDYTEQEFNINV